LYDEYRKSKVSELERSSTRPDNEINKWYTDWI